MARKPLSLAAFAVVSLLPVPLLVLGAVWGGAWLWAGFLYMAGLALVMDRLVPQVAGDAADGAEFPGSDALLVAVAGAALGLLPLATWAVAGPSGLEPGQRILLALGAGFWLGQVGHPAAHELIHRGRRRLFWLGAAFYTAILFGQHASAHRLVHHRHVASGADPNTARAGEGFYAFARRAWTGSFLEGKRAEDALRARQKDGRPGPHPYAVYLCGGAAALVLALVLAGPFGVLVWGGMAAHAQVQLLVSDYVQHYGLTRAKGPDGRLEPVGMRHSWNSGPWFSSALTLNAGRHSDHHANPSRPYPALRLPDTAPLLPWPLPLACAIAFVPRVWKRAMKAPLRRWADAAAPGTAGITRA